MSAVIVCSKDCSEISPIVIVKLVCQIYTKMHIKLELLTKMLQIESLNSKKKHLKVALMRYHLNGASFLFLRTESRLKIEEFIIKDEILFQALIKKT